MAVINREREPAASNWQAARDGAPPACPFKAERAQRAQDGQAGGAPTESVGRRRAGAGSGAHRAACGIGATEPRTQDDRGDPSTATEPTTSKMIRPTPHKRRTPHTSGKIVSPRRGARGAGRRADATGRGAAAKGRKAGRPPKTFAPRSGAGARQTLATSHQRAANEHSSPAIRGIID